MKTLVNAIDYACRLREGPGNKNISLGSVLKLLLVSHIAVVFAALLVVAVAKSHCIIWQLLWLPELLTKHRTLLAFPPLPPPTLPRSHKSKVIRPNAKNGVSEKAEFPKGPNDP